MPVMPLAKAVYPRVGGGNGADYGQKSYPKGLSPRGRGKPLAVHHAHRRARSIPAWAGETNPLCRYAKVEGVYPRVGGGN